MVQLNTQSHTLHTSRTSADTDVFFDDGFEPDAYDAVSRDVAVDAEDVAFGGVDVDSTDSFDNAGALGGADGFGRPSVFATANAHISEISKTAHVHMI